MSAHAKSLVGEEKLEGLWKLASDLREERLSIKDYLELLDVRFQKLEQEVHAFVTEAPQQFARLQGESEVLMKRFPDPKSRPVLFGIPVGVKDIIHCDGMPTGAGSRIPPEVLQGPEADVVRALKEAGALILGKTVTTEFAYFEPGPTRNPHDTGRTPGGSSSGSAAAVACGLCPLALGTQTIGSVIRPASFCGVVGFKPTYGRISLSGVIPLSPSADHLGFFCRDVEGVGLVASILSEGWRETSDVAASPIFGVPEGPYLEKTSAEGMSHFLKTLSYLSEAGFEIRSLEVMPDFDEIAAVHNQLVAAEAAAAHKAWISKFAVLYSPRMTEFIKRGVKVSPADLEAGKQSRLRLRNSLQGIMEQREISAWLAPSAVGPATSGLESTGDPIMNLPWTHAGVPAMNLPSGKTDYGMPMGLQVIGGWMKDEELVDIALRLARALP